MSDKEKILDGIEAMPSVPYQPGQAANKARQAAAADGTPTESTNARPSFVTLENVFDRWAEDGPLVHEPTGISAIDERTGGGPVYGTRWFITGAPNAWKTGVATQTALEWASRGIVVGILAVDEEDTDLTTRFAQMAGFSRAECEVRDPDTLMRMRGQLKPVAPYIRMFGSDVTIETAAADLAAYADTLTPQGKRRRVALFVDSIQVATCAANVCEDDPNPRTYVTANTKALRTVASRYRLIAIATSEMNRGGYRDSDASKQVNDMASAAETRAIEYSARVLISLRSVPKAQGLIEVRLPKNKHGESWRREEDSFYLEGDRVSMRLRSVDYQPDTEDRNEGAKAKVVIDAASAAIIVAETPGIGVRELYSVMRAKLGSCSKDRVDAAVAKLGKAALLKKPGRRGARHLYLNGEAIDPDILSAVPDGSRDAVLDAKWPKAPTPPAPSSPVNPPPVAPIDPPPVDDPPAPGTPSSPLHGPSKVDRSRTKRPFRNGQRNGRIEAVERSVSLPLGGDRNRNGRSSARSTLSGQRSETGTGTVTEAPLDSKEVALDQQVAEEMAASSARLTLSLASPPSGKPWKTREKLPSSARIAQAAKVKRDQDQLAELRKGDGKPAGMGGSLGGGGEGVTPRTIVELVTKAGVIGRPDAYTAREADPPPEEVPGSPSPAQARRSRAPASQSSSRSQPCVPEAPRRQRPRNRSDENLGAQKSNKEGK